jgi:putative transposase
VVSNATRTVSSGQIFLRRGIGASVGHLPEIGLPTEIQRKLAATLPVARPKRPVLKDHRPLEPICGNIVGAVVTRLIGAVLLEANDEWQLQHRYMQLEAMAELAAPDLETETLRLPPKAA